MIIRLTLVESEPVIFKACNRHSGAVCRLDAHGRILHNKALVLTDSQSIRCIVLDLRIRFALFKLLSTDDEVKFRAHAHLLHDPRDQLRTCGGYQCDCIAAAL